MLGTRCILLYSIILFFTLLLSSLHLQACLREKPPSTGQSYHLQMVLYVKGTGHAKDTALGHKPRRNLNASWLSTRSANTSATAQTLFGACYSTQ